MPHVDNKVFTYKKDSRFKSAHTVTCRQGEHDRYYLEQHQSRQKVKSTLTKQYKTYVKFQRKHVFQATNIQTIH